MAQPIAPRPHRRIFTLTSLGTKLLVVLPGDSTVSKLKAEVSRLHSLAYPDIGRVSVSTVVVAADGPLDSSQGDFSQEYVVPDLYRLIDALPHNPCQVYVRCTTLPGTAPPSPSSQAPAMVEKRKRKASLPAAKLIDRVQTSTPVSCPPRVPGKRQKKASAAVVAMPQEAQAAQDRAGQDAAEKVARQEALAGEKLARQEAERAEREQHRLEKRRAKSARKKEEKKREKGTGTAAAAEGAAVAPASGRGAARQLDLSPVKKPVAQASTAAVAPPTPPVPAGSPRETAGGYPPVTPPDLSLPVFEDKIGAGTPQASGKRGGATSKLTPAPSPASKVVTKVAVVPPSPTPKAGPRDKVPAAAAATTEQAGVLESALAKAAASRAATHSASNPKTATAAMPAAVLPSPKEEESEEEESEEEDESSSSSSSEEEEEESSSAATPAAQVRAPSPELVLDTRPSVSGKQSHEAGAAAGAKDAELSRPALAEKAHVSDSEEEESETSPSLPTTLERESNPVPEAGPEETSRLAPTQEAEASSEEEEEEVSASEAETEEETEEEAEAETEAAVPAQTPRLDASKRELFEREGALAALLQRAVGTNGAAASPSAADLAAELDRRDASAAATAVPKSFQWQKPSSQFKSNELQKLTKAMIREVIDHDRLARGMKKSGQAIYRDNDKPDWWPLPEWNSTVMESRRESCAKVYNATRHILATIHDFPLEN